MFWPVVDWHQPGQVNQLQEAMAAHALHSLRDNQPSDVHILLWVPEIVPSAPELGFLPHDRSRLTSSGASSAAAMISSRLGCPPALRRFCETLFPGSWLPFSYHPHAAFAAAGRTAPWAGELSIGIVVEPQPTRHHVGGHLRQSTPMTESISTHPDQRLPLAHPELDADHPGGLVYLSPVSRRLLG
jgi:hypothetical protein